MITVKNEMRCADFEYETSTVKIEGNVRINNAGKVAKIDNGMAYLKEGNAYVGSFGAGIGSDNNLKININDIAAANIGNVAVAINSAISELEEKYSIA